MISIVLDYGVMSILEKDILSALNLSEKETFVCELSELSDSGCYELPDNTDRCVIVSLLQNGIMKCHEELISKNENITSWVFSVVNVEYEAYKEQYSNQIDVIFSKSDSLYETIFDDSKTFEKTQKACRRKMKEKKQFYVISKNIQLAKRVTGMLKNYLSDWEVEAVTDKDDEKMYYANVILLVGEKIEDFEISAPQKYIKNHYVWINKSKYNCTQEEKEYIADEVDLLLSKCGWDFTDYKKCCFYSDIKLEEMYCQLKKGDISFIGLKNDDCFVMWDSYGLPALPEYYTEQNIHNFLEDNCCFSKIAKTFSKEDRKGGGTQ